MQTCTEAPSEQDEYINSIEDPELQQQLRWLQYLERLNAGAWGDHIAVQGLADMLHVDIHIISTINPDKLSVSMQSKQPVQLQNCTIQKQLHSEEMEVIIAGSSNVSTSPRKFAKVASTTEVNNQGT